MSDRMQVGQPLQIEAEGAQLSARFFPPKGTVRAYMLLHGATGVRQRFYAAFADWAAARGVGVLTYDYRDFGDSQRRPLRQSDATMADWAVRDQAAAEARLAQLAPDGPLWLLGHSLGGLGFPFVKHDPRVERITTVGAGHAHFSDHPWSYRPTALAFWFVVGPIGTAIAGYLPGKRLLLGADLPAGVYWQWRRWCTRRDFFQVDIGKSLPQPDFLMPGPAIRMFTMEDDVVVPPAAVRRYASAFPEGRVDYRMLRPSDFGLPALRHIEVFSKRSAAAWPTILGMDAASVQANRRGLDRAARKFSGT